MATKEIDNFVRQKRGRHTREDVEIIRQLE
jgi:hypothetical protein